MDNDGFFAVCRWTPRPAQIIDLQIEGNKVDTLPKEFGRFVKLEEFKAHSNPWGEDGWVPPKDGTPSNEVAKSALEWVKQKVTIIIIIIMMMKQEGRWEISKDEKKKILTHIPLLNNFMIILISMD